MVTFTGKKNPVSTKEHVVDLNTRQWDGVVIAKINKQMYK